MSEEFRRAQRQHRIKEITDHRILRVIDLITYSSVDRPDGINRLARAVDLYRLASETPL
jgi:hypothetical protein